MSISLDFPFPGSISFLSISGNSFNINPGYDQSNNTYGIVFRLYDGAMYSNSYYQFSVIVTNRPPIFKTYLDDTIVSVGATTF